MTTSTAYEPPYELVLVDDPLPHVRRLTLNRPEKRNALSYRLRGELVDAIGGSQPGVSKHLRVLREAGLVEVRAEGKHRLYALNPEPLLELDVWLAPYRRLWAGRLDALGRHLDERQGDG